MTNKNFRIDTEILISLIEERRCIWDSSNEDYKNRDVKNKAFEDVTAVVVSDFKNLTEAQKQAAVKLVQQRWRTARDAYRRDWNKINATKSCQAVKKIKKYVFFENLEFLNKVPESNATETNFDHGDEEEETSKHDATDLSEDEDNITHDMEETVVIFSTPKVIDRKKRKKDEDIDAKLISFLESTKNSDESGDRAFLESLLPTLNTFDESRKFQFRAEVIRIMMEIKNIPTLSQVNNNQIQTNYLHSSAYQQSKQNSHSNVSSFQAAPRHESFQINYNQESYSVQSCSRSSAASSTDRHIQGTQPTALEVTAVDIKEYHGD